MRLPRMTTRRWMVVAAVIAAMLGGGLWLTRMIRIRSHHLAMAQSHAAMEAMYGMAFRAGEESFVSALMVNPSAGVPKRSSPDRAEVEALKGEVRRAMLYHTSLRRKYEHAARYPWLPVEPDPPRPD